MTTRDQAVSRLRYFMNLTSRFPSSYRRRIVFQSTASSNYPQAGPGSRGPGSPEMQAPAGGSPYGYGPQAGKPKTYTNLDLIRADTPYTTTRISKMLHQLEFKLQVEMQYKKGIDKMAKLYQADGDKRSKADAESKRIESERKIQLLQTALKRYKTLHILDDEVEDDGMATACWSA